MADVRLIALKNFTHSVGSVEAAQEFMVNSVFARELIASGLAATELPKGKWSGKSAVLVASGTSVTEDDLFLVRSWRDENAGQRVVAVINTTYQRAPWADLLYAADKLWWEVYHADVNKVFAGEKWSASEVAKKRYGVSCIECERRDGLSKVPGVIHHGGNSGYQLIGLLVNFGIKHLVLVGYDMQKTNGQSHHHGEHPHPLRRNSPYELWLPRFRQVAADARDRGITIVNATRTTALKTFKQVELSQALEMEVASV